MADSVSDRVGQQFGNYRLQRLLRRERMMDIYLGEHLFLKTQAEIEVLVGQLSQQESENFLARTRNVARLKHPNIPRLLEFGVEGQTPFLVTDYTPNGPLRQRYPQGTTVAPDKIVSYVTQVAAALQYIHAQNLVHRGVRPENILSGAQNRILLSGFSPTLDTLNEGAPRDTFERREETVGALPYMAPEQLQAQAQAIPASDQYALAVVVCEWLSGRPLFHGSSDEIIQQQRALTPALLQAKLSTVSPELIQVLMTALSEEPSQRFADISAFASALEKLLQPAHAAGEDQLITDGAQMFLEPAHVFGKSRTRPQIARGVGIATILIVLLLIGGAFLYSAKIFPSTRPIASVPSVQMTQTSVARGTQQAVATFTAHPVQDIYTLATSGTPLINDPLNTKSKSRWESIQGNAYSCTFGNDMYSVRLRQAHSYLNCAAQKTTFHNFAFEVEMRIVQGDIGGITFRTDEGSTKFYALRVVPNGADIICSLALYNNATIKDLQNTAISADTQKFNLISVIAYEQNFYLYLNKKLFMKLQNTALQTGSVGMYVANADSTTADVMYRNAKVWTL